MSHGEVLQQERLGAVAVLTISRPEKRNALNAVVRGALLDALADVARDPAVRVAIITGAGEKSFVAGADIAEFAERTTVDQYHVLHRPSVLEAIERNPKPVIAAINGYCLGGGLELAMACDIRLAASHATFGQPEVNLGIIPGGGGTQRLPRLVGLGAALRMILTGDSIAATEAWRLGLIEELVPAAELMPRAMEVAERMAAKSPLALAAAKEAVRAAMSTPLAEGLRIESGLYLACFSSEDKQEGVRAFLEKRPAHFTGR